jgi:hypothetical protein
MSALVAKMIRRHDDRITVRVECLVENRQLKCPLFDKSGTLQLGAGKVLTRRFKELLSSRGIPAP